MKKLFPGITNQDINRQDQENTARTQFFATQEEIERSMFDIEERERQQQAAILVRKREQQEAEAKKNQEINEIKRRRDNAHLLYGNGDTEKLPKRGRNLKFWFLINAQMNIFLFVAYLIIAGEFYDSRFWGTVNEVYDPTPKTRTEKGIIADVVRDKPFFCGNAAFVCAWMIFTACVANGRRKKDKAIRQRVKSRHATIDMMLDIKNEKAFGRRVRLNDKSMEKLINMCPEIISNMSADDRVYFDMLLNGDIEIANNETFKNMAISVMQGHLKAHPEDLKKVMSTFDEKSIVEILSYMYQRGIRR